MKFPSHVIDLMKAAQRYDSSAGPALHDALIELGLPKLVSYCEISDSATQFSQIVLGEVIVNNKCCDICKEISDFYEKV